MTRIAAALREEILRGAAAPGTALREEQLAARFHASRHTVRTALAHLAGTGLVRSEPYHGTRVTSFDRAQAEALQDLRRALESEAVEILRQRFDGGPWPAEVRGPIEAALDRLGAVEAGSGSGAAPWVAVQRAHSAVHAALVAAAGSPRITEAHARIADELDLLLLHARPLYQPGELLRQHRQLLDALQRDGAAAIRAHLDDTLDRLGRDD